MDFLRDVQTVCDGYDTGAGIPIPIPIPNRNIMGVFGPVREHFGIDQRDREGESWRRGCWYHTVSFLYQASDQAEINDLVATRIPPRTPCFCGWPSILAGDTASTAAVNASRQASRSAFYRFDTTRYEAYRLRYVGGDGVRAYSQGAVVPSQPRVVSRRAI